MKKTLLSKSTKSMGKKKTTEKENLSALLEVCEEAVSYVGLANWSERESLAKWNVRKAFNDFQKGKKPQWAGEE